MPTSLPPRRDATPPVREPGLRDLMIAAAMLMAAVGLVCEQRLGPTPGYSLSHEAGGLQLSP